MRTGRPPKKPEDRKTDVVTIPLSPVEKELILAAASLDDKKHVTWSRNTLLAAAKKRIKGKGGPTGEP